MPNRNGAGPAGPGRGGDPSQRPGGGPGGECVCPNCGKRVGHDRGSPCTDKQCPACGSTMTRG